MNLAQQNSQYLDDIHWKCDCGATELTVFR